jgi:2-amino-4-hydroxy-6-hydroxymethyldihydropteridine diphosphokinase
MAQTGESDVPIQVPGPAAGRAVMAYLCLGSNLGDREAHMKRAVRLLAAEPGIEVVRVSGLYETSPVGGPAGQRSYLNAAVAISTMLSAEALLLCSHRIESDLGRVRAVVNGPRTIDIDLLLYGERVMDRGSLKVPHPSMHLRRFVLVPLSEIAPDAIHPVCHCRIRDLLCESSVVARNVDEFVEAVRDASWCGL